MNYATVDPATISLRDASDIDTSNHSIISEESSSTNTSEAEWKVRLTGVDCKEVQEDVLSHLSMQWYHQLF